MIPQLVVAIFIALGLLLLAGYGIWQWGPGLRTRFITCPHLKCAAEVLVEPCEGEFGVLTYADIKHCSLLKGEPVDCDKECIARA